MKNASKFIFILALVLIVLRIAMPVRTINIQGFTHIEFDPLFHTARNHVQQHAKEMGATSITNLFHISYIITISAAFIFFIEKNKKTNKTTK